MLTRQVQVLGGSVQASRLGDASLPPVLLLHGGPGSGQSYLLKLAHRLAAVRPVIIYDQLGCGASERPSDPTLWTVARFVDEVERVRSVMARGPFHLFGHSWGALLAAEYALTRPPDLLSLCLASPCLDIPRVRADMDMLRRTLPEHVQALLARHEAAGTTRSAEYRAAVYAFARRYVCRLNPWPNELVEAEKHWGRDVYEQMWGPAEFHICGSLRDHDCTKRLGSLKAKVLLLSGRHDEMRPDTVACYAAQIPGARHVVFEASAHLPHLEQPDRFVQVLTEFLDHANS